MIKTATITSADLSMADHDYLTLWISIEGDGWGCNIGGYCLEKGYVGAKEFKGSPKGIEEIMRVMDVVGVSNFSDLVGKNIRVETGDGWGSPIIRFGHIIKNKWFDYEEFYSA